MSQALQVVGVSESVGDAIKRERELVGVTQAELALACEALGHEVSRVLLAQYEAGNKVPAPARLKAIADALGVTKERLLGSCPAQDVIRRQQDRRYVRRPKFNARDAFTGAE
jgi:transcriptional regulator with XRE-family HTH domain